jgi:hypothetical protein
MYGPSAGAAQGLCIDYGLHHLVRQAIGAELVRREASRRPRSSDQRYGGRHAALSRRSRTVQVRGENRSLCRWILATAGRLVLVNPSGAGGSAALSEPAGAPVARANPRSEKIIVTVPHAV